LRPCIHTCPLICRKRDAVAPTYTTGARPNFCAAHFLRGEPRATCVGRPSTALDIPDLPRIASFAFHSRHFCRVAMPFSPIQSAGSPEARNQTPRADPGRRPGAAPNRRAWKQVSANGTRSTRAADRNAVSQLRRDSRGHADAMSRRDGERKIIARPRSPKKHSAPECWSPRRAAPAAERFSNAVLECPVYTRFAVTSQSKLPWTRRRRSGALPR
jgi:hypothetical protein